MKLETEVIKRKLPRPAIIPAELTFGKNKVQELVDKEMLTLIYSDAIDNPIDGIIFPDNPPEYKQEISFERLEEARSLIAEEI